MQCAHDQLVAAYEQLMQTLAILQAASPSKTAAITTPPSTRLSTRSNSIDNNNNLAETANSHTADTAATSGNAACEVVQEIQLLPSIGTAKPPTIEALKAMVEEVRSKRRWVRETLRQVIKYLLSMVHNPTPTYLHPLSFTTGTRAVRRGPRSLSLILNEQHSTIDRPTTNQTFHHPFADPTHFSSFALGLHRRVDWFECSTCRHPP